MKQFSVIIKNLLAVGVGSLIVIAGPGFADSMGEPGRESGKPNPLKNVYFGEEHMHTRNSFDAFTIGVNQTWDQAYEYAKGKEVTLSTTGIRMKKRTPFDFVAITDHAEYYGVLKEFSQPQEPARRL